MGTLRMSKLSLDVKKIKGWSPEKKRRFVMLTAIMRDLIVHNKLLLYVATPEAEDEFLLAGGNTMRLTFSTLLMGKLCEMAKFIHNEGLRKDPALTPPMRTKLDELYGLFEANDSRVRKLFDFVRNKLAFHYEHMDDIEPMLEAELDALPSFDMFLSETDSANEVYAGTTEISWNLIIGKMGELGFRGERAQLIRELLSVILKSTAILREFSSDYAAEMLPRGAITAEESRPIEVKHLSEINLPFFFLPDDRRGKRHDEH